MDIHGQLVEQYLNAPCKRVVLDAYLDGRHDRKECEDGEEQCEGCQVGFELDDSIVLPVNSSSARGSHTPPIVDQSSMGQTTPRAARIIPIVARHQQEVRERGEKVEQIHDLLNRGRGRCVYCYMTRQQRTQEHYTFCCPEPGWQTIQVDCQRWKKRLRGRKELAPFGGCHWCFLPQEWCNRWREMAGAGRAGMYEVVPEEKHCQYQDIVVETLAVWIHLEDGFQAQMQGRMGSGIGWDDVSRYWGQRVR